jgi:SulP family sulfate permease
VIAYSRVEVVRYRLTGDVVQSRVTRSPVLRQRLRQLGQRLAIMQLQGFIFFGTADRLLKQIRERIDRTDISALRFALLDFQRVTGMDSTGLVSFEKLKHAAAAAGTTIVITDATLAIREQMERGGLQANAHVQFFRTLDQGIEWCENILLREEAIEYVDEPTVLVQQLAAIAPNMRELTDLLPYLERCEMAPGTHVIVQGDPPDSMFFIESGQLTAQLEYADRQPVRLETMGSGRVVGEIGFYLGQARTASVIADVPSIVYRLSRETLTRMEQEAPETASALHRVIVHLLSERLTHMIGTVNALQQ